MTLYLSVGLYSTIHHRVSLRRFHELEPQRMLSSDSSLSRCGVQVGGRALLTAQQMSEATLEAAQGGGKGTVPFPAVDTNTLVLSDSVVLAVATTAAGDQVSQREAGEKSFIPSNTPNLTYKPAAPPPTPIPATPPAQAAAQLQRQPERELTLAFRVGDSRSPWGSQIVEVEVKAYLHRWRRGGGVGSPRGRNSPGGGLGAVGAWGLEGLIPPAGGATRDVDARAGAGVLAIGGGGGDLGDPRIDHGHESHELALTMRGGVGSGGGNSSGLCRMSLWTPVLVEHTVDENSPLRAALVEAMPAKARGNRSPTGDVASDSWDVDVDGGGGAVGGDSRRSAHSLRQRGTAQGGALHHANDAGATLSDGSSDRSPPQLQLALDAEIVVIVEGTLHSTGQPCVRRRCYRAKDVRVGHVFAPIVQPPSRRALWAEPQVDFDRFHTTSPVSPHEA